MDRNDHFDRGEELLARATKELAILDDETTKTSDEYVLIIRRARLFAAMSQSHFAAVTAYTHLPARGIARREVTERDTDGIR